MAQFGSGTGSYGTIGGTSTGNSNNFYGTFGTIVQPVYSTTTSLVVSGITNSISPALILTNFNGTYYWSNTLSIQGLWVKGSTNFFGYVTGSGSSPGWGFTTNYLVDTTYIVDNFGVYWGTTNGTTITTSGFTGSKSPIQFYFTGGVSPDQNVTFTLPVSSAAATNLFTPTAISLMAASGNTNLLISNNDPWFTADKNPTLDVSGSVDQALVVKGSFYVTGTLNGNGGGLTNLPSSTPAGVLTNNYTANIVVTNAGVATIIRSNSVTTSSISGPSTSLASLIPLFINTPIVFTNSNMNIGFNETYVHNGQGSTLGSQNLFLGNSLSTYCYGTINNLVNIGNGNYGGGNGSQSVVIGSINGSGGGSSAGQGTVVIGYGINAAAQGDNSGAVQIGGNNVSRRTYGCNNSVMIGYTTGYNSNDYRHAENSVLIGAYAGTDGSILSSNYNVNSIAIGYACNPPASNSINIGNTIFGDRNTASITIPGSVTATNGFILNQLSAIPTNSIPSPSSTTTNWVLLNLTGNAYLVATNTTSGGWLYQKLTSSITTTP